jgi:hypothetical protein
VQARSLMEYRQAQLRLEQLYTQIRMQVINAQFALTNDRAAVLAAEASQKFNAQSLDAEQKKLHLGASTTALVLQQSRNLATAENSLTSARAAYAQAGPASTSCWRLRCSTTASAWMIRRLGWSRLLRLFRGWSRPSQARNRACRHLGRRRPHQCSLGDWPFFAGGNADES